MPKEAILLKDQRGRTAFHVAAENRSSTSLGLLVDTLGEVAMQQDNQGNTPLHFAVKHGKL